MIEPTPESPSVPRRTIRRARAVPFPRLDWQQLWLPVGLFVLLVGFWALRPRTAVQPRAVPSPVAGMTGAPEIAAPVSAAPVSNEKPGDGPDGPEPGKASAAAAPSAALDDSALVGNPTISPAAAPAGVQESYTVQPGDTLGSIADRFEIPLEELMRLNGLADPNWISIGQVLLLPGQVDLEVPHQRVIPDSELVLSPAYRDFDLAAFVRQAGGYLASHSEEVEGQQRTGIEIVEMVGLRYGVGYRPLLAMLEYQSGWVTSELPTELAFPLGDRTPYRAGLFFQLSWAANHLNEGFYNQLTGRQPEIRFPDGTRAMLHPDTPPGTAAIQNFYSVTGDSATWSTALAEDGFYATYRRLFGDPWANPLPLMSDSLAQPALGLPWADEETWYFTGGPHGGWGELSGWAALDFVPPDNTGCQPSSYWATAVADGRIIRSDNGEVVLDLDGDGFVGTGWTILYMHIYSAGRADVGTTVKAGDPIGRPSCEGGVSDAAHLHLARRYNGVWIEADGSVPMLLEGWQAFESSAQYDGTLKRGDEQRETCACRENGVNGIGH